MTDLTGRVAAVTGAARGIGAAAAHRLAQAGAFVACLDNRPELTAATASAVGGSAYTVDVSRRAEVHAAIDDIAATHGRIDVLVNAAGIMHDATVLECPEVELDRVLDINFKGQFWACQAAGRHMVAAGRGSIINLASSAIDFPRAGIVCYAVSKAAVSQLVRSMAMEVGPAGVRVNGIAPGYIDTPMTQARFVLGDRVDTARRDAVHGEMRDRSPLGRIGRPDDIAEGVLYLASDASSFVTGQMLRINGGVGMAM